MTSSFTNMYLAAYLCFNLSSINDNISIIDKICESTQDFLDNNYTAARQIVEEYDFQRIVYLGSNALKGIAQESSLKMLELTAGKVVTMYDTPLGFRHGPKSIIDDTTLTVVYVSDDEYTRKYELDLIKEISGQRKGNKLAVVYNGECEDIKSLADYSFSYDSVSNADNIELGLAYITFAQTLAVLKSLAIGLTPDNPCPSGEVNRVVKGVTLYPYTRR